MIKVVRDPIWWGEMGTKETVELLLMMVEYKYAKKTWVDGKPHNVYYGNVPLSFDIEDSSFYDRGEKVSTMYVWQFGFAGTVIMGRTWDDFVDLVNVSKKEVRDIGDETNEYRLIVYVQFLDHEFQFIRKLFIWQNVFSRLRRSPIYAITDGIEFRDSYILTGKSLEKIASDLREGDFKKMVGDLDYSKIRGRETPLSDKETGYCMADVLILNEFISEKIEDEGGNIGKIPLTNTGYVRRAVRKKCLPTQNKLRTENAKYFRFIHGLTMEVDEYDMLSKAFQGGFTHGNYLYIGETLEGKIDSIDFTSSYPAHILADKYPMTKGELVTPKDEDELRYYLEKFCCVFTISFKKIVQKTTVYDGCISRSKCTNLKGEVINNGRIYQAEELTTTITDVDFQSIEQFYDWESFRLGRFYIYGKGYLPKPIIESCLDFYKAKTTLKGVEGEEVEYMLKKGMLNSIYGMMVTSPLKELVGFDGDTGEWLEDEITDYDAWEKDEIDKYNTNKRRFLFYPWGVFVTAYARRSLYSGILEFGEDYIYSDTDSIKCLNIEKHMDYIRDYDRWIVSLIDHCLEHYGIDPSESRPKNVKGEEKQIGVWDIETEGHPYTRFKTLGAKRYIYEQDGDIHITIAGVSKKMGRDYIADQDKPFDFFSDGMTIDADSSGKLTHTYLDYPQDGVLTDYTGRKMEYHEMSSVHLEKSSYEMSISEEFKDFCLGVRKETSIC